MEVARALAGDLWAVASGVGLMTLAGLLGTVLLARMTLPRPERLLLSIGLGLGLLAYLPFALGLAGMLNPKAVRVALLVGTVAAMGVWAFRRSGVQGMAPHPTLDTRSPLWAGAIAGVGGLFLLGVSLSCLTPMVDHDGLAYHVGAPKRWLELGALEYLPTHLHTQWPMGSEMLYLLLLPLAGDTACKPFVALLTGLTAMSVYALGRRVASPMVGLAASGLFLVRAGVPSINTTSVEMALTLFVTLSAVALAVWAQSADARERRALFALAALLAGFGCGTKLNGLLCAVILAVAVLLLPRPRFPASQRDRSLKRAQPTADLGSLPRLWTRAGEGALFGSIAVLCAAPWYLRTWINTGNPVYPFAYSLFGGAYWSAEASAVLSAYFHTFDLPGSTFAERHQVVVRHVWKLALLMVAGLALPGPRWTRGFILAAGLFAILQVWVSDIARFLLPATPFAVLVLAWWLAHLAERWPVIGWGTAAALAALYVPLGVRHGVSSLPVVLGWMPRDEFIGRFVNNRDAFLWANRHLPANARVLYGPDNRTYFLQRPVYWSSAVFQRQIVYDTPQAFAASLRREGITHLIWNRQLYRHHADAYEARMGWRANEWRRVEETAERAIKLWEGDEVAIYRL